MNTQENNKLIAEFMGLEYSPKDKRWDDWFTKEGTRVTFGSRIPLQFHTSWDWLMPVLEKIEKMGDQGYCFIDSRTEDGYWCQIGDRPQVMINPTIKVNYLSSKKQAIYQAVVEFIKQYNK